MGILNYILLFTTTCITAPIVEEFTFRVLIYDNWFYKYFNKRVTAALISSIIFSISHFNLDASIYTFIVGIILCFIYDIYGYISTMVLHMLFNIYTFFIIYGVKIEEKTGMIIAIVSLIISSFFIRNKKRKFLVSKFQN